MCHTSPLSQSLNPIRLHARKLDSRSPLTSRIRKVHNINALLIRQCSIRNSPVRVQLGESDGVTGLLDEAGDDGRVLGDIVLYTLPRDLGQGVAAGVRVKKPIDPCDVVVALGVPVEGANELLRQAKSEEADDEEIGTLGWG